MAKRKTHHKHHHGKRRSHRMGAVMSKGGLTTAIAAIAGGVAAKFAGKLFPDSFSSTVKNGILATGGVILAGQKSEMMKGLGLGLAAVAGANLLGGFGIGQTPLLDFSRQVTGFNKYANNPQLNTIAGFNSYPNRPELNVISGVGGQSKGMQQIATGAGLI